LLNLALASFNNSSYRLVLTILKSRQGKQFLTELPLTILKEFSLSTLERFTLLNLDLAVPGERQARQLPQKKSHFED